jgi:DNA-binding transcriptional ArsR family regulator
MLAALLDGRALTAIELACAARITPQTASFHLAKLIEAGLRTATKNGRHRYFRLAPPKVFEMPDSIMTVAIANKPKFRPLSREDEELNEARICYDHIAGCLNVDITDFFTARSYISLDKRDLRRRARAFLPSPVSISPHRTRAVAGSANCALIGRNEDHTSRTHWEPRWPTVALISVGSCG